MDLSQQRRQRLVLGVCLALVVAVAWMARQLGHPVKEPPPASDYYTGAFHAKGDVWVTADGKIVAPPPSHHAPKKKRLPPVGGAQAL